MRFHDLLGRNPSMWSSSHLNVWKKRIQIESSPERNEVGRLGLSRRKVNKVRPPPIPIIGLGPRSSSSRAPPLSTPNSASGTGRRSSLLRYWEGILGTVLLLLPLRGILYPKDRDPMILPKRKGWRIPASPLPLKKEEQRVKEFEWSRRWTPFVLNLFGHPLRYGHSTHLELFFLDS